MNPRRNPSPVPISSIDQCHAIERLDNQREKGGLRGHLMIADGQRHILVRPSRRVGLHELRSRDASECIEQPFVVDAHPAERRDKIFRCSHDDFYDTVRARTPS